MSGGVVRMSAPTLTRFRLSLVDVRTQLLSIDSLREGAVDEYALFRDSWLQRRNYQIGADRIQRRRLGIDRHRTGGENVGGEVFFVEINGHRELLRPIAPRGKGRDFQFTRRHEGMKSSRLRRGRPLIQRSSWRRPRRKWKRLRRGRTSSCLRVFV